MQPVALQFLHSFAHLPITPARWDAFAKEHGADLFCSFAWCDAWWRHFGRNRQLLLCLATRSGQPVAIIPLYADTIRIGPCALSVIRLVGSDYGVTPSAFVVAPNAETEVAEALSRALEGLPDWDILYLGELTANQKSRIPLVCAFADTFGDAQVSHCDLHYPQMFFAVPSTFEEYAASLGARERNNLFRDLRKGNDGPMLSGLHKDGPDATQRALARLFSLHAEQWRTQGRLGHLGDWPGWECFLADVAATSAATGNLLLTSAYVGEQVVASELTVRFGDRAHWIIGGRTSETSSRVGFASVMRAAIDAGVSVIDALGGDFAYKRRLGADQVGLKTITVVRPRATSVRRVATMRKLLQIADALYFRTWTWRIAPVLRRTLPWCAPQLAGQGYWQAFMRARFLIAGQQLAQTLRGTLE